MQPATARRLTALTLVLFAAFLLRTAWLCDDSFITLRTVDNFLHGYGLRWNVDERVQGYTHPLWMLLVAGLGRVTRELPHTVMLASMAISLAAVALAAFRLAGSPLRALWLVLLLSLSKSVLSFSTSGLENPLTHLLLAAFLVVLLGEPRPRRLLWLSWIAGLALLNRLDSALLFGPPLLFAAVEERRARPIVLALTGLLPLLAWESFSLFYYGSPFPATYYAKLSTGIRPALLAEQGGRYYRSLLLWDPLGAAILCLGLLAPIVSRNRRHAAVVAGLLLHLIYVRRIGGDFMCGRFLAAPIFCAAVLLCDLRLAPRRLPAALLLPLPLLGLVSVAGNPWRWFAGRRPEYHEYGILDERVYSYPTTGLLSDEKPRRPEDAYLPRFGIAMRERGARVVVEPCIGQVGYYAGPTVHIIDNDALTEPLLSRIPVVNPERWRIGHFDRAVPPGYEATRRTGKNQVRDRSLAAYWDKLSPIVEGDLLAPGRLREIWRFNRGAYDPLLASYLRGP